ncbi:MAG: hypothetical protein WHT06_02055 [Desulfobacterales bacterium]
MTAIRILLFLTPFAFGASILGLGQDISWDLRNYHYYNPFAFLFDRLGHDVAVAHVATYYNPLLYIPFYHAVTGLPPRAVGFLLGFLPGLNAWLIYAVTRRAIDPADSAHARWFCLALTAGAMLGMIHLAEIGTSFGDTVVSLPVLGAVLLLVRFRERLGGPLGRGVPVALAAGALAGSACGVKLPFAVYCVGLCVALFALPFPFRRRFTLAFLFGVGVLAGIAATGGFWMLEMWRRFENPVFPYFNEWFRSPWGAEGSYRDERFIPRGPAMWLLFPFWFNVEPSRVGEVGFRDLRFPLIYVLLVAAAIGEGLRRMRRAKAAPEGVRPPAGLTGFFITFFVVSFLLWMKLFSVYRYAVVCEYLAPLTIYFLLARLLRSPRRLRAAALAAVAFLGITLEPGHWGRRPWTEDYFDITLPPLAAERGAIVLVTGHDPVGYLIPSFPPEARFLRIQGFVTGPSPRLNETDRLMMRAVAEHEGPLLLLYRIYEEWHALHALEFYGLELDRDSCQGFVPGIEPQPEHPFFLCRVCRRATR